MKNCNFGLLLDKEAELRKRHQMLTWAFLLMAIVFIVVGLSVWGNSLPWYSIILVTVVWIAIDCIRDSIGGELYRITAYQKAQEHKMQRGSSEC